MLMRSIHIIFLLVSSISVFGSQAIGHAPIGVMADHMHKKGESMKKMVSRWKIKPK